MANSEAPNAGETKLCPLCAEPIQAQAVRCKHCHADFGKNSGLAALLSFFAIGSGQIYNGRIGIGLAALLLCSASLVVSMTQYLHDAEESKLLGYGDETFNLSAALVPLVIVCVIVVPVYLGLSIVLCKSVRA